MQFSRLGNPMIGIIFGEQKSAGFLLPHFWSAFRFFIGSTKKYQQPEENLGKTIMGPMLKPSKLGDPIRVPDGKWPGSHTHPGAKVHTTR